METILVNMCMIYDRDKDKILILDKVKIYHYLYHKSYTYFVK